MAESKARKMARMMGHSGKIKNEMAPPQVDVNKRETKKNKNRLLLDLGVI